MNPVCGPKVVVLIAWGCLVLLSGCDDRDSESDAIVDTFAVGATALANAFAADTMAAKGLERAHYTAQVQQALISPSRPILVSGNLSDMELTRTGWRLRVDRIDFWGPNITYLLDCDSVMGNQIFSLVRPKLDSMSYFYEGPNFATVAKITSVSKALYSVDADVYGSGEELDYTIYVSGGSQIIARGTSLGFFVD